MIWHKTMLNLDQLWLFGNHLLKWTTTTILLILQMTWCMWNEAFCRLGFAHFGQGWKTSEWLTAPPLEVPLLQYPTDSVLASRCFSGVSMSSVKLPAGMPEAYWETHFRLPNMWTSGLGISPSSRATQPQGRSGAMRKTRPPIVLCMQSCVSIHSLSGGSPAIRHPRAMRNLDGLSLFHSTPLARSASATDRMPSISSARTFSR